MKKILILFFILLPSYLVVFPKPIRAQGTFGCEWAVRGCAPDESTATCERFCTTDRSYCGRFSRDRDACENAPRTDCVCSPPGTCSSLGGTCRPIDVRRGCPPGEKSEGRKDCVAGEICCTKQFGQKIFCDSAGRPTTNPRSGKLYTAIGCIPIQDKNAFAAFILRWGIGIGGGIAFLLILLSGFQIITSAGDPKKLQAGKELLTAALTGLLLLILSVFILRIIGIDILGLPEF